MDHSTLDNRLSYDDATHSYYWCGKRVPGVSEILTKSGVIDTTFMTEAGRDRGTAVHDMIELDLRGLLDVASLHPILTPYYCAWRDFRNMVRLTVWPDYIERKSYAPKWGYAGRYDCVALLNGRPALLDWKSGGSKWAHLQTAAYSQFPEVLALGHVDRFALELKATGKFSLKQHRSASDFADFCGLISLSKPAVGDVEVPEECSGMLEYLESNLMG